MNLQQMMDGTFVDALAECTLSEFGHDISNFVLQSSGPPVPLDVPEVGRHSEPESVEVLEQVGELAVPVARDEGVSTGEDIQNLLEAAY